jgi:hypothetical protein
MIVRLVSSMSFSLLAGLGKIEERNDSEVHSNCNKGRNLRRALLILGCGLYFARLPEASSDEPGESGQQTEHREHGTKMHG